jgi:hypothetical protein
MDCNNYVFIIEVGDRVPDPGPQRSPVIRRQLADCELCDLERHPDRLIDIVRTQLTEQPHGIAEGGIDAGDGPLHVGSAGGETFATAGFERLGANGVEQLGGGVVDKLAPLDAVGGRCGNGRIADDPIQ